MRYLILLLLLAGCSATWHVKQAKRHKALAIAKGAQWDSDTVKVTVKVPVFIKGDSSSTNVAPVVDDSLFNVAISKNDSLVIAIHELQKNISSGATLDKEKTIASINASKREIQRLRERLKQGFSKDSVYVIHPDTLTTVTAEIKDGILRNLSYVRKDLKLEQEVVVPVSIKDVLIVGKTWWQYIGIGLILLIVGLIIGYVLGLK